MKTLAVQASSGNLSATERGFLDVEFQNLLSEIDRVAEDTDFNGTKLLDGTLVVATEASGFSAPNGVSAISPQGVATGAFGLTFAADTAAGTYDFTLSANGGDTYAGSIDSSAVTVDTGGNATLIRATTVTLDGGSADGKVTIALNTAFSIADANATGAFSGSDTLSLSFKLGSGTESEDSLSFSLSAIDSAALGLTSQTIDTEGNADAALEAVNGAIDTLNEFRADVGASQNRLDFAASNLKVSIENAEAARSTLLDLDIAQEMTNFTSKQVLMQSGVAMLAQANQMPQNLLRLLQ
jgi:flagellin